MPDDWRLADYCNVTYNTNNRVNGAELEFLKKRDAPYMETKFSIFFGRVEVVAQAAPGPGIISSIVLWSSVLDEIDYEWRGSLDTIVQTNYFGKGITASYNRSTTVSVNKPMTAFHTYAFDWSATRLNFEIDGHIIRTLQKSDCNGKDIQYPQSPSKLALSLWDAGDPDNYNAWGGGKTPIPPPAGGYSYFIKSVKIWNSNPAASYTLTDKVGNANGWKLGTAPLPSSATVKSSAPTPQTFSNVPSLATLPPSATSAVTTVPTIPAGMSILTLWLLSHLISWNCI